jgi:hypothetical protein
LPGSRPGAAEDTAPAGGGKKNPPGEWGLGTPLRNWLDALRKGQSTLPAGLTSGVLAGVVRALLGGRVTYYMVACDVCGLSRPLRERPPLSEWRIKTPGDPDRGIRPIYDLEPHPFPACPHCGEPAWTYSGWFPWGGWRPGGRQGPG